MVMCAVSAWSSVHCLVFSKLYTVSPRWRSGCLSFLLPEVICHSCNHCRDIDLQGNQGGGRLIHLAWFSSSTLVFTPVPACNPFPLYLNLPLICSFRYKCSSLVSCLSAPASTAVSGGNKAHMNIVSKLSKIIRIC